MKIQSSPVPGGGKFKVQNYSLKFEVLLRILLICLTFNFALLTFNLDKAEASALSLGIDPPIITINAIPPTTATGSFSIQNKSDVQVVLQIQLKPFKAKGENGELFYLKDAPQILGNTQILDAGIPVNSITLGPRQQKNLSLNINLPQDANISARPPATSSSQSQTNQAGVAGEVGRDYYFSITFVSTGTSPTESSSSINQVGIAANVLLSVGPKEIPKASLEEFSTDIFFQKGPVPFTIRVKNEGAHFIKPKGEITIKNMFGQSIGKLDLFGVNILSGSIRTIPNDIYMRELRLIDSLNTKEKNPPDFKQPIALWKENFLLGFYTATLNISMSDEGPAFTRAVYFFAFPFQELIIIAAIIIGAIVVRKRLKLHMNKNRT